MRNRSVSVRCARGNAGAAVPPWHRFHLVNEALEERAHMLAAAPFMVKPLPIMIPIYKYWEARCGDPSVDDALLVHSRC
jgi:glycerol-3-phosphate dehydrogenase